MVENIKAVNNPLTIIAIFAALAEIAGTTALAIVDKSLQITFVWFVMGFPVLLLILFFATLNFNPKVLYAPSDFKNEENFLSTLVGTRSVSISLDQVTQQLEDAKGQILNQVLEQIATVSGQERKKLTEIVNRQLNGIEVRLESVRREAEAVASTASGVAYPQSILQAKIIQVLANAPQARSVEEIATQLQRSPADVRRAVDRLAERSLLTEDNIGSTHVYRITKHGGAGD